MSDQEIRLAALNAAALANAGRGLNSAELLRFAKALADFVEEGKR